MPAFLDLLERICVEDEADVVLRKVHEMLGHDLESLDREWRLDLARKEAAAARERGDEDLARVLERFIEPHE